MPCERSSRGPAMLDLDVVAYISMAFGNPYGDAWSVEAVVDACTLADRRRRPPDLACGYGRARVAGTNRGYSGSGARGASAEIEIGVHLHARRDEARPAFALPTMQVAGGSTRPSAGWADARSRRMRWWGICPRKH